MNNTILITGDFCPRERVAELIENGQHQEVLKNVKPIIEQVDYAIVNLEAPIVEGQCTPIAKSGPNLRCSPKVIDAIKYAGFDCVTLANNHFYDYGEMGAYNTLQKLEEGGVTYVGAGHDAEDAAKVLYLMVGEKRIAIINCCEREYSIATNVHAGSNALNPITLYYSIREAKEKSDYIVVIVHGGIEQYQLPTPRMQETYRFAIDCGADAVVNHHQHCYSGYEVYKGHPIFYGLGNFSFDRKGKRDDKWNEGYMVKLNVENDDFELLPYIQCNDTPAVTLMEGEDKQRFFKNIGILNGIITLPEDLENSLIDLAVKSKRGFNPFTPYTNPKLKSLYRRGWLPSFVSKKKLFAIQNKIECESHLERLRYVLRDELKD